MKKILFLFLLSFLMISCKKDKVDASSTQAFQSSINDMASSLTTLQQTKFNEALYILKKFAVPGEDDITELKQLAQLLNGKNTQEILSLADETARKNNMDWTSTGPPSLGEMNIFGNVSAKEVDKNDIEATSLNINIVPVGNDSIGIKAIQVVPRLVDNEDKNIEFTDAGLEALMEVSSGGTKLLTAKNIVSDNNFKGFRLNFSSLPESKIFDNKIDVKVSIKTTKKTFQLTKTGIAINPNALQKPKPVQVDSTMVNNPTIPTEPTTPTPTIADPKTTVSKFLNNLNTQNLKAAYENSQNPNWGSYESFSNPTSGFGAVKSLSVKNISTTNTTPTTSTVVATYDVVDKSGKSTSLKVNFGLKNTNGEWKISSYQIQ
ncbi:MAG: hypothetical protein JST62_09705 [Bacteroidetes bacterium]|nr:hypothetical protein [Bacteroidota bacterium]